MNVPTPPFTLEHQCLVSAAVLDDDVATPAWTTWRDLTAGRVLDAESVALLPLLYASLKGRGLSDPVIESLKSRYQHNWARNQVLLGTLPEVEQRLRKAAIPFLLLKGAAMLVGHYRDAGARSIGDIDLLVAEDQLRPAVDTLAEVGWVAYAQNARQRVFDGRFAHAVQLYRRPGLSLDLHCHVLREACGPGVDAPVWAGQRQVTFGQMVFNQPRPEHLFVIACVHGHRPRPGTDLRWVADALMLCRGGLDWEEVGSMANALGLGATLAGPLSLLRRAFTAPVPAELVAQLQGTAVNPHVASVHQYVEIGPRRPLDKLRAHRSRIALGIGSDRWNDLARALPAYLKYWFQIESAWMLPLAFARQAIRRVSYWFGRYDYDSAVKTFLRGDTGR